MPALAADPTIRRQVMSAAREILADDAGAPVSADPEVNHFHDVRMANAPQNLSLDLHSSRTRRFTRAGVQHLEREAPPQELVLDFIDAPRGAPTERPH